VKHLEIAEGLRLPLETVTETISLLAKRGAGKTYTASVVVEEMLRVGAQVVVLDPMGAWWGLRSSADGKGEGYPIAILGGERGEIPLEHTAGALVAETIVETGISAVLDVSEFSRAKRKRFVQDFAEALYQKNREPLHLVLEEADLVAPQKPQRGEEPMLGAIEDLVRRGRGRGIGVTLITQRSAVLNKDVLSQTEVLIALRTTSPHDRKAVEAWLDFHLDRAEMAQVSRDLPKLETGEAFVISPALLQTIYRGKIRTRTTFDSSATPRAGERRIEPKKAAEVDLEALREKMADTIEAAAQNDPKALRGRIATLEREIERLGAAGPEVVIETKEVPVPVLDLERLGEIEERLGEMWPIVGKLEGLAHDVKAAVAEAKDLLDSNALGRATEALRAGLVGEVEPLRVSSDPAPVQGRPTPMRTATGRRPGYPDDEPLKEGAWTILRTAAERFPMVLTRAQLATLSGYSARSSSYEGHLAALRRAGYLEKRGDVYELTDEGAGAIGPVPGKPTTFEDLLRGWLSVLPEGAGRLLSALVEHGEPLDRGSLFEAAGFSRTSSTPGEHLATLRRNGLVEVRSGEVYPSGELILGKKGAA
jgi:hypothetical protein